MMYDKKKAMLYILEILKNYSDENHLLTQKDIIDKLRNIYHIELERKTISTTLELLIEHDYDIIHEEKGGYYLGERDFNDNEIKFLVDAIYSSRTIPGKEAAALTKKLYSYLSEYQQKDYQYLFKSTEINRINNNEFFLNIALIQEAIKNKKKISFQYLEYDEKGNFTMKRNGYRYKLSPYFLINNFNKYYLLGNIKWFKNHVYYRVEFMTNIEILDDPIHPYQEVETMGKTFDINKHINDHIYMFGGPTINAEIEILDKRAVTYVYDWFGKNAKVFSKDDKLMARIKSNDQAFFYWALQYQDNIKILSPQSMIDKVVDSLEKNIQKYK